MDARRGKLLGTREGRPWAAIEPWLHTDLAHTYDDRDLDTLLRGLAHDRFHRGVAPSCLLSMQVRACVRACVRASTYVHLRIHVGVGV
jgi:hypothetical protein